MADFNPRMIKIAVLKNYHEFGYDKRIYELVNESPNEINKITINTGREISYGGVSDCERFQLDFVKPGERREFRTERPSLKGVKLLSFSGVLDDGRAFRRALTIRDRKIKLGWWMIWGGCIAMVFSLLDMFSNSFGRGVIFLFFSFTIAAVGTELAELRSYVTPVTIIR